MAPFEEVSFRLENGFFSCFVRRSNFVSIFNDFGPHFGQFGGGFGVIFGNISWRDWTNVPMTKKAKQALLQATRETLHRPSSWLTFNGPSLVQGTSGEGQMFRVFDCARVCDRRCEYHLGVSCEPDFYLARRRDLRLDGSCIIGF